MAMNPLQMMMLMQGAQGLADNFGAAQRGVPQQQGGMGGGAQGMVPLMAMMQRGQLAQQDMDLERQKFAAAQQAAERQRAGISQFAAQNNMSPEQAEAAWGELQKALASRYETRTLGEKDEVYGPDGSLIAQNAADPEFVSTDIGPMNKLTGQIDPNKVLMQFGLNKARSGATNVSVSPTAIYGATQGAFDQEIYKESGKAYVGIQKEAEAARKMAQDFRQIDTLLGETPTGEGFDKWRLQFAKAARGLGIPVDEKQIATKEAAEGLVNQFALSARSPDGPLGGLPGATSDRDIEFLRAIPPGIEQTPQGRKLMVEAQEAKAEHRSKRAAAAREYIRGRNGEVDPVELDAFKAAYDKEHPIYGGLADKWQGKLGAMAAPADPPSAPKKGGDGGTYRGNPDVLSRAQERLKRRSGGDILVGP